MHVTLNCTQYVFVDKICYEKCVYALRNSRENQKTTTTNLDKKKIKEWRNRRRFKSKYKR